MNRNTAPPDTVLRAVTEPIRCLACRCATARVLCSNAGASLGTSEYLWRNTRMSSDSGRNKGIVWESEWHIVPPFLLLLFRVADLRPPYSARSVQLQLILGDECSRMPSMCLVLV
jgi:hypothetical protein